MSLARVSVAGGVREEAARGTSDFALQFREPGERAGALKWSEDFYSCGYLEVR